MFFVYILRTSNDKVYIGSTSHVGQRIQLHRRGKGAAFTKSYPDLHLVYMEKYPTLALARQREIQLKTWSRAKKEALIAGNFKLLKKL